MRQDRAHPDRSTPAQQTFYRGQAESALGQDENLYRIEWEPERSTLSIQLLGKDSIADDDLAAYEREWSTYLEQYVLGDPTPGVVVSPNGISGRPFLSRNLRAVGLNSSEPGAVLSLPRGLVLKSALQSKICMRSYKIFFVAGTEDELVRYRDNDELAQETSSSSTAKVERFERFVKKRFEELERVAASEQQVQKNPVTATQSEGKTEAVDQDKGKLPQKEQATGSTDVATSTEPATSATLTESKSEQIDKPAAEDTQMTGPTAESFKAAEAGPAGPAVGSENAAVAVTEGEDVKMAEA